MARSFNRLGAQVDWVLGISSHWSWTLITDNDLAMLYDVGLSAKSPSKGLLVGLSSGCSQRFVALGTEFGWRMQDTSVSSDYPHGLKSVSEQLMLSHRASVWLPTSRTIRNQGLRMAPTLRTSIVRFNYRLGAP